MHHVKKDINIITLGKTVSNIHYLPLKSPILHVSVCECVRVSVSKIFQEQILLKRSESLKCLNDWSQFKMATTGNQLYSNRTMTVYNPLFPRHVSFVSNSHPTWTLFNI